LENNIIYAPLIPLHTNLPSYKRGEINKPTLFNVAMENYMNKEEQLFLQQEIAQKEAELYFLVETTKENNRAEAALRKKIEELKSRLLRLKTTKEVTVSEHALVRILERGYGFNVEKLREEIKTKVKPIAGFSQGGKCSVPLGNGLRAVVVDSVVVTILGEDENEKD